MTKSEALALSTMLPKTQRDIQEVHIRLKMHREGNVILDDASVSNCEDRLERAVDTVQLVNKMALAELG